MFGIALGIKPSDFKQVALNPKGVATGFVSQFVLLPALTCLLILALRPHPALALGMILVAACPGGNISNFIASISGGNTALSVALTGIATLVTPILTPLNFEFWGSIIPYTAEFMRSFSLNFLDILQTVLLILVMPLLIGLWFRSKFDNLAAKIEKPIRVISVLILIAFIIVGLSKNIDTFMDHMGKVFGLVLIHNALALAAGYGSAVLAKLQEKDRRTVAIETGIQNSGLGLIVIFTFFDGNGGMAIIAAWWGIWHMIAGFGIAYWFSLKDKRQKIKQSPVS